MALNIRLLMICGTLSPGLSRSRGGSDGSLCPDQPSLDDEITATMATPGLQHDMAEMVAGIDEYLRSKDEDGPVLPVDPQDRGWRPKKIGGTGKSWYCDVCGMINPYERYRCACSEERVQVVEPVTSSEEPVVHHPSAASQHFLDELVPAPKRKAKRKRT